MVKTNWVEVSLSVSCEQAEAVAEVLSRFMPNGVVVEQFAQRNNHDEFNLIEQKARVFGYLLVNDELESKCQKLEEALWHLSQIQPLAPAEYKPIQDEDWMAAWRQQYHPIEVGKKLIIVPAWLTGNFTGRIPIRINPGMAFGTGTHPSTQLCLQLLEETIAPDETVIDIGCGSGILSIAALKLGTSHVLAVDNDPAAVRSTQENAKENQIANELTVGLGSVGEILENKFHQRSASLVVVNILASVILELFEHGLADLVNKNGRLILAGILDSQTPDIIKTAENKGFTLLNSLQNSDWSAILLKKYRG